MIFGFIALVLFLLTALKFVTKRLPFKTPDAFALKIHKISGISLLAVTIAHAAITWKLIRQRPIGMYIAGLALVALILAAILSHVLGKKQGRKWLRAHRAASALVCACLILHVYLGISSMASYRRAVAAIAFSEVDVGCVADGTYDGVCDAGYVYAGVRVTVISGEITAIDLQEHRTERGRPAEKVVGDVLLLQTVDVDAVSGATNSSLVIRKAIENALLQGAP